MVLFWDYTAPQGFTCEEWSFWHDTEVFPSVLPGNIVSEFFGDIGSLFFLLSSFCSWVSLSYTDISTDGDGEFGRILFHFWVVSEELVFDDIWLWSHLGPGLLFGEMLRYWFHLGSVALTDTRAKHSLDERKVDLTYMSQSQSVTEGTQDRSQEAKTEAEAMVEEYLFSFPVQPRTTRPKVIPLLLT